MQDQGTIKQKCEVHKKFKENSWKRFHTSLKVCILTSTAKIPKIIQIFISRHSINGNNLTVS